MVTFPQEMENQTAECAGRKPDISSLDHEENEDMGELSNAWQYEACQKQNIVMRSSTEAELVALYNYILKGELVEEFIINLGTMMDDDFVTNVHLVNTDNQSTIAFVKAGGG